MWMLIKATARKEGQGAADYFDYILRSLVSLYFLFQVDLKFALEDKFSYEIVDNTINNSYN